MATSALELYLATSPRATPFQYELEPGSCGSRAREAEAAGAPGSAQAPSASARAGMSKAVERIAEAPYEGCGAHDARRAFGQRSPGEGTASVIPSEARERSAHRV